MNMNGHDENKMDVRVIDVETGEEIASFDSLPMDLTTIEQVDCSVETDITRKVEWSTDFINMTVGYEGVLKDGQYIDVKGIVVHLRPGEMIPKRKRQRKKWWKQRGEEMELRNVLVKGAKR